MDSEVTRRQFNKGLLATPFVYLPFRTYPPKTPKFRGRYGVIHFRGTQYADDKWRLNFRLGASQYNNEGQRRFLWVVPSDELVRRLQEVGMLAERCSNPKQITVDAVTLPHGPVGLALLLESKFNDQDKFYIHPSADELRVFRLPATVVKKSLWIEP